MLPGLDRPPVGGVDDDEGLGAGLSKSQIIHKGNLERTDQWIPHTP
jgi:hypothetical protein